MPTSSKNTKKVEPPTVQEPDGRKAHEVSPVKFSPQAGEPIAPVKDQSSVKTSDDAQTDMTDEDFVEQVQSRKPKDRLEVELQIAKLCAGKKEFNDRRGTLKKVGMSNTTFSKYLRIGQDDRITDLRDRGLLSARAGFSLLYEISLLSDDQLESAIENNIVGTTAKRATVERFRKGENVPDPTQQRRKNGIVVTPRDSLTPEQMSSLCGALAALCKKHGCDLSYSSGQKISAANEVNESTLEDQKPDSVVQNLSEQNG